ncbi:hypothetical protein TNCV_2854281 [Trichonephila clavipes]|uniref:Uncharacterized protein n=1 Tax=Trichonephila clavipes TaxID=2585209 RepID=A0A8X6REV3_TRICX|nr:hypothetical protein TNCV_2854281 [Trichonephila clavipes]
MIGGKLRNGVNSIREMKVINDSNIESVRGVIAETSGGRGYQDTQYLSRADQRSNCVFVCGGLCISGVGKNDTIYYSGIIVDCVVLEPLRGSGKSGHLE